MLIFLALLVVPLLEIGVFIEIGGRIGLWPTLVLIVATAIAGAALLRHQGLTTLARARASMASGRFPIQEVVDGVCLLVAGALLLTPGFVTDAAGGLLLVPWARHLLQRWALSRMMATGRITGRVHGGAAQWPVGDGDVVEGEYSKLQDDDTPAPPRDGKQAP